VERVSVSRGQDGRPRVEITYRFVPPAGESSLVADFSADGVQSSVEFARAYGWGGSEGVLRGHPKMSFYKVAVDRETKA